MPSSWSDKDERQYEHIKESNLDRGMKKERAKEVAARTVNKQRREEGRTPNEKTQGTGNPNKGLESRTKDELYQQAKDIGLDVTTDMKKSEIISKLRNH